MELHPLHKLYLGSNHGETATFAQRARFAEAAEPAGQGSGTDAPAVGRAVPAALAALVALVLAGKPVAKAAIR